MVTQAPAVVVVAAGRHHMSHVEDVLTALSGQTLPVDNVLVTAPSAHRTVAAFQADGWTVGTWHPRWLLRPGMPTWMAVLQVTDLPFGHWAEQLVDLGRPGPAAVFGRMASQPIEGPIAVEPELFTAALPASAAARVPLRWWRAAAPQRAPDGLTVRSTDAVLALRRPTGKAHPFRLRMTKSR